jgi:pyruvate,orthophosphate dikinase
LIRNPVLPEERESLVRTDKRIVQLESGSTFPQDPFDQIRSVTAAVFNSYASAAAHEFRKAHSIPESAGTAVGVCAMIFGNLGDQSANGYLFTRSPSTGEPLVSGEYQMTSQRCSPAFRATSPLDALKDLLPDAHAKLQTLAKQIERRLKDVQIIGFAIENGEVWIVKSQVAKRSSRAAVRVVADFVAEGLLTKEDAISRLPCAQIEALLHPSLANEREPDVWAAGEPASSGTAAGELALTAA